jgi:HEPN domain-containing protein
VTALSVEVLLNDFALRSFRDIADGDYITARWACRTGLLPQYLWASQQAVEKYLKCILLLHRIPPTDVWHDLSAALQKIEGSQKLELGLTERAHKYIEYLDTYGRFRYLETSHWGEGRDIVRLDQVVWEIRRYCTLTPVTAKLHEGSSPPRVTFRHGHLEKILNGGSCPARAALIWQNAFFGKRVRRTVRVGGWAKGTNAPLALHPEIMEEAANYVFLPKEVRQYFRQAARKKSAP